MATPIFDHAHPKIIEITFKLSSICTSMQKISSFHKFILKKQLILESHDQTGHTHFWPYPTKNFLIKAISLISSVDIVDKNILQSDWLKTFWPTSQEQKFSQIWDLYRNTANKVYFHYRTNSVNINDQIFKQIQKTLFLDHFWSIFPIFGVKKFFLENPYNSIWLSSTMPKFRKN